MPAIKTDHFDGAKNVTGKDGKSEDLAAALRAVVDDNTALRNAFVALLAKLDADAGVTDANYAATLTPAALTLTKA